MKTAKTNKKSSTKTCIQVVIQIITKIKLLLAWAKTHCSKKFLPKFSVPD